MAEEALSGEEYNGHPWERPLGGERLYPTRILAPHQQVWCAAQNRAFFFF